MKCRKCGRVIDNFDPVRFKLNDSRQGYEWIEHQNCEEAE